MKYLLLIVPCLLLLPGEAGAVSGDAARFDFSAGQPAITADNTTTCNDTATVRYDFSSGRPAQVFDATANCTAAAGATAAVQQETFWFD
jgi:hypothetical protein